MLRLTRCTSPSVAARSTGPRRPDRSSTTSMPRATSSALKSCPPARFWRRETGKKLARQGKRGSAPRNNGSRRRRLCAQELRLMQHWVPDLRDPKVLADIRNQAKLMAQHPENDAIDAWNLRLERLEVKRGDS